MDEKPKVLMVHNYYQIPGGEDTVVANEKKLLEDHGHKTVLYTRHNSELKTLSIWQKIFLPFSTVFNIRTYKEVKKIIKEEQIDLVHVHNTLNLISPSVYYAAFSCHVPVVQTVHNFRLLCPGATFYRDGHPCEDCVNDGLMCAVRHKCYRDSTIQTLACVIGTKIHRILGTYQKLNYICLTEFNKDKLLQLKQIQEKQIFVKPNFVENAERIIPYKERKNQFVYVGRLEKIKGIEVLLKAWKFLGGEAPELFLCGSGPLEAWARDYIQENHLSKVILLGFVPNEKVRQIIGESKALILPTQVYEGFPMTILEAYSVGTPVIGSDLGNTGALIKDKINGIRFKPQSEKDLVKAIKELDIEENTVLDFYKSHYSMESNYEKLQSIYQLAK